MERQEMLQVLTVRICLFWLPDQACSFLSVFFLMAPTFYTFYSYIFFTGVINAYLIFIPRLFKHYYYTFNFYYRIGLTFFTFAVKTLKCL